MSPAPRLELDPAALRARYKRHCATTDGIYQNWQIRLHRSLSWFARAVEFPEDELEARFLYLWIALNSLYSRWDPERNAPDVDTHARTRFIERVCTLDPGVLGEALHTHRGLVRAILGDPYLSSIFWRNPDDPKAKGRATQDVNYLDRHLKHREHALLLNQVLDRLFILRGQIVHGASTRGSRLNRTALRRGTQALGQFLPLILHVVIELGCDDDWPALCYPPEP